MIWQFLASVVGLLPWQALKWFGRSLGWLVGSVLRIRRRQAMEAMARAGVASPDSIADGVYAGLGTGVFELLWLAGRSPSDSFPEVSVDGWERVEKALAAGKGIVVATAHTGNWDLAACAMVRRVPLTVVTKRLSIRSLDRFWQSLRAGQGVELLDARGAVSRARKSLGEGRAVVFLIDQAPLRANGIERAQFMGCEAEHDAAFAWVAARSRAPVVLAFPRRRADGTHEVVVRDVVVPPDRPGRAWVRQTTLRAAQELEAMIREHPDQWLWLHRRWRRATPSS